MASSDSRPLATVLLAVLAQGVGGGLGWSVLPPLMPQISKELGLGHAAAGLIWGMAPAGIALASLLGGAAVDRFGPRRVAGLALLVGALTCAARAACHGPVALGLAMFAFGAHIGFTAPAIPKLLVAHVAPQHLGRATGAALLAYTLGTAATVMTARTVLVPLVGGWRPLMVVAGAAVAVVALIWLALARDRALPMRHASLGSILALGLEPNLLRLGAMQFLIFGGYLALLGLLPAALLARGVPAVELGRAIAAWLVAAGLANLGGPLLSDLLGLRRPVLLVGGVIAGGALLAFAAHQGSGGPWLLIAALGGGSVSPLLLAIPMELEEVGPQRAGAGLGLLMLVGQVGGFLLPVLTGALAQSFDTQVALVALGLIHLLVIVPALGLRETGRAVAAPAGGLGVAP